MIYWIINSVIIILLGWLIIKTTQSVLPVVICSSGLIIRLVSGILGGILFYTLYPETDSISFFTLTNQALDEGSLWSIFNGNFDAGSYTNQPRVLFFIKVLSVFLLISGGSYWIASLYLTLLSFAASAYFVTSYIKIFNTHKTEVIIAFFFIPSILFWSSGILKDTLAFSAFLILITLTLRLHQKRIRWYDVFLGLLFLIVLFKVKHYLLITWLIFTGILIAFQLFLKLKGATRWAVSLLVIGSFFTLTQFVHPYLNVERIPQTVYELNHQIIDSTNPEKQLAIRVEEPTWKALVMEVPKSLFVGLFRPNIFDSTPVWGIPHKIENLILTILFISSILIFIQKKPKVNWHIVIPSIVCICMLAILLTMTTPNLGTLVRYKNAFMPFLFFLVSILPYQYITSK